MRLIIAFISIILLLAEWRCWRKWHSGYYRVGFVILKKKMPFNRYRNIAENLVSSSETNEHSISNLSLRKISEREVAVRTKYFLLPPVRGRMIFSPNRSVLKLQLYVDWFVIIFLTYVIPIAVYTRGPGEPLSDILGLVGGSIAFYLVLIDKFMFLVLCKNSSDSQIK